ncbi:GspE/PulE family protein [Desulfurivibrio alkaliphilus]|uniref:Type II secretion system protein E n=1 Tax=Desulfurivibrio alkaliphilus (strain DSM 19089 / UNIQEM U267 / AHT2) TaxID=589865 RepID=D6Z6J2_DESAT|nr:ATPase, T2SS/T4P/T4SS family [Desulfurivibrio alkaliphilus]ADH84951.1 type II secretion system protein E [Desulfurivibrio alkaliphilus AHT 2]
MKRPFHNTPWPEADLPAQGGADNPPAGKAGSSLDTFVYPESTKQLLSVIISPEDAQAHLLLPLSFIGNELTVAVVHPEKREVLQDLRRRYDAFHVSFLPIGAQKFTELYHELYQQPVKGLSEPGSPSSAPFSEPPGHGRTPVGPISAKGQELPEPMPNDSSTASASLAGPDLPDLPDLPGLAEALLTHAAKCRASAIHFEQEEGRGKVRYRIDGVLQELEPGRLQESIQARPEDVVSRLKILANLEQADPLLPQHRVFRFAPANGALPEQDELVLRLATCPAVDGESFTINILDSRKARPDLEMLGHAPPVLQALETCLAHGRGMVLVAGPPGSGKNTTLQAILEFLRAPSRRIVMAEEYVTARLPGVMQTAIDPERGLTAPRLLRSFLPLDPDVIMLDRFDDRPSMRQGVNCARQGPLFLSSIAAVDGSEVLARFEAAGCDRAELAALINGVLVQRLVRRICPDCKTACVPERDEWGRLFVDYPSQLTFFLGKGCALCDFTGFKGRTLLSELFVPGAAAAATRENGREGLREAAASNGLPSLLDDGLLKLGETTLGEILRVVPAAAIARFRQRTGRGTGQNSAAAIKRGRSFLLTDPAGQRDRIDRMYEFYRELSLALASTRVVERALFHRFITTSYREIKRSAASGAITFNFTAAGDRVKIAAIPRH